MSIAFNGTTSRLLRDGGSLGLAYPVSIFVWLRPNSSTVNQFAAGLGNTGGSEELMVYAEGAGSGRVRAFHMTAAANSTTPISTAWTPALAVFTSQSSRTIYYGAGAAVTETTSVTVPLSVINRVGLGNRVRNDSLWFAGDLAEFAIWSGGTALGQTEFDALAAGAVPSTVSSGTLWDYWDLLTDAATQTGVNGRVLTAFNTSQGATHPIGSSGPTFTAQPSNQSVNEPTAASFSATYTGSITGHQWQVSTNGGSSWSNVTDGTGQSGGAGTGATLTYTTTATAVSSGNHRNGYQYRCVLNPSGTPVNSNAATLTVTVPSATQLVLSVPDAAGLSGFNGIVLSASAPGAGVTVIATPTSITFNGSGQATINVTGLGIPVGQRRWVSVTNSNGDPAQSPAPVQAQGPVTAS